MSDYISREAFKEKYLCCGYLPEMSEEEFDEFPAADVAPVVHGRWEVCDYVEPDGHGCGTTRYEKAGLRCTHCVHVFKRGSFWKINYFPNCGAKMEER